MIELDTVIRSVHFSAKFHFCKCTWSEDLADFSGLRKMDRDTGASSPGPEVTFKLTLGYEVCNEHPRESSTLKQSFRCRWRNKSFRLLGNLPCNLPFLNCLLYFTGCRQLIILIYVTLRFHILPLLCPW